MTTTVFPFRHRTLVLALALAISGGAHAATLNVTGDCTLVAAINNANTDTDTDGIGFGCKAGNGADTLNLGINTLYTLTAAANSQTGLPLISSAITVNGNGSTVIRSTAPNTAYFRLVRVTAGGTLKLNKLTLIGGRLFDADFNVNGGGILNNGNMTLNDCIVSDNRMAGFGGGISNTGTMTLNNSVVSNNGTPYFGQSGAGGSGISNDGTMTLNNSRVSGNGYADAFNLYTSQGGGILNRRVMAINNSTISDNTAYRDGGISNSGKLTLNKSTVSGNHSTQNTPTNGAGITNSGNMTLDNSAVTNNFTRNYYGEGGVGGIINSGKMTLSRSVVKYNKGVHNSGIRNSAGGSMKLENSSVSSNFSFGGPAIVNLGNLVAVDSAFSHNGGEYSGNGGTTNIGTMTISNSRISNNHGGVMAGNGGISNTGKLTISGSTISGNTNTISQGGGISNLSTGTATLTNSIVSNNNANGGGGIANTGTMTLAKNLISGNKALYKSNEYGYVYPGGGGIYNKGTITVANSTLSGNSTDKYLGGGIANKGVMSLSHITLTDNATTVAAGGGGIKNYLGAELTLSNSVVANSKTGGDCHNEGVLNLTGKNLIEDGGCGAPLGGDPKLALLLDNGGPTATHALLPGSPAIDAADKTFCIATDQRNIRRPVLASPEACDLGAFERQPRTPASVSPVVGFFDQQAANGAILGTGIKNVAKSRLEALRNKLLVAGYYFNRDKATEVCAQLAESLKRIDTKNAPDANDYVTGTATGELTNQINALRADKQCQ